MILKALAVIFVVMVAIRVLLECITKAANKTTEIILRNSGTHVDSESVKHNNYFPYKVDEDQF